MQCQPVTGEGSRRRAQNADAGRGIAALDTKLGVKLATHHHLGMETVTCCKLVQHVDEPVRTLQIAGHQGDGAYRLAQGEADGQLVVQSLRAGEAVCRQPHGLIDKALKP